MSGRAWSIHANAAEEDLPRRAGIRFNSGRENMTGGAEVPDFLMEAAEGKLKVKVICRDEAPSLEQGLVGTAKRCCEKEMLKGNGTRD